MIPDSWKRRRTSPLRSPHDVLIDLDLDEFTDMRLPGDDLDDSTLDGTRPNANSISKGSRSEQTERPGGDRGHLT